MRLGLFGGSFDPVHHGHLALADCCAQQAQLDVVWFVPAAGQPLKPNGPQAANEDRVAMLKLALGDRPRFEVSEIEIHRGGVSYTAETLAEVHAEQPETELFFLMGADSLADLPRWHRPEEICELAMLLVVRRAGAPEPNFDGLADLVESDRLAAIRRNQVEMPEVAISSSEIRQLIATGGPWQEMVPGKVADYITTRQLYAK